MAATHESGPGSAAGVSSTTYAAAFPPALQYCEPGSAERATGSVELESALGEASGSQARGADRESRNQAEKQRRNTLNAYIKELSLLLPSVVESPRKIDKTGTLRLAANDLRKEHVFGKSIKSCHMEMRPARALSLLELLGGFVLTVTCKGIVTVVSPNVQSYLGHCQVDLLGQNLYGLVHPDDAAVLERHIYPPELHAARADPDADHSQLYLRRREFFVRIVRASPRSEPPQYELCRVDGMLRRADYAATAGVREEQIIRRQRVRRDRTVSSSGNDVVFNGMVRVAPRLPSPARAVAARSHTEYWTRHLIDGRVVQCDQRVSIIAGYMTDEVVGASGFTFMHKEDVRWVVFLLRQMYDQSKEFGESCYRFMTASGQFIYLKTKGFLEVDKCTKAVQSFVCVNSIVPDEEGQRYIEEMKRKYSVLVDLEARGVGGGNGARITEIDDQRTVEDPQQLEQVIMHLVTNLPSPGTDTPRSDDGSAQDPSPPQEPLTIIPPEPGTISIAIRKSVSVICQAGIKFSNREGERAKVKKRTINSVGCDSDSDIVKRRNSEKI